MSALAADLSEELAARALLACACEQVVVSVHDVDADNPLHRHVAVELVWSNDWRRRLLLCLIGEDHEIVNEFTRVLNANAHPPHHKEN